jgi:CheY-like chemotaxis protein
MRTPNLHHVTGHHLDAHCEIRVSDTGRGIAADFLPYVFDRFSHRDRSTVRTEGGLGLGLAIVKQLAEHHGGSVTALSQGENRGATFIVSLPVAAEPSSGSRTGFMSPGWEQDLSLEGTRILVVDEDADACLLLRRLLEQHRATVETVSSAPAALALIKRRAPDIVLAELDSPDQDGYRLIAAIRALPGPARAIPTVGVTASGRLEDRMKALTAGYHMHVAKPIDVLELLTVIQRVRRS